MKTIYLAGPDVFEPDPFAAGEALKQLCSEHGFEGLFPLDNAIEAFDHPHKTAEAIRKANIDLIRRADIVMANLNPFRGFEPDSGTVYEVGFAEALGKPVFAYAADRRHMLERLREHQRLASDAVQCLEGKSIESFALSHNLMFAHTLVADNPRGCLRHIAERFC
ncbi:nucleoside 2-deoxyribosyltransferase [Sulfurimonas sp. HSL-3221]|uniref:nucleoside 2-deoxyribosyltransferase n=1 Tax=Thiomicrolovo sulfuroxydans TaxID=2894755 RepID=UPI001E5787E6|nr:nucleoside 2-deoxyribosyltransferase [Sulfurimonas sp. HSL-3221]UFS62845.1 nucleoside 2-deoxyribosyltransferase [Sulfurimonas sp. HSL-3221]